MKFEEFNVNWMPSLTVAFYMLTESFVGISRYGWTSTILVFPFPSWTATFNLAYAAYPLSLFVFTGFMLLMTPKLHWKAPIFAATCALVFDMTSSILNGVGAEQPFLLNFLAFWIPAIVIFVVILRPKINPTFQLTGFILILALVDSYGLLRDNGAHLPVIYQVLLENVEEIAACYAIWCTVKPNQSVSLIDRLLARISPSMT